MSDGRGPIDHVQEDQTMAKFVFIYTGGTMPETPGEGQEVMQAWSTWLGGLGSSVIEMGNPFGASASVTASGVRDGGASRAGGYSVIDADSLDDATKKADGCPALQNGGTVEVYEAIEM